LAEPGRTIALVMAGGLGSRMSRTRPDVPKPLVEVCGLPLIEILVRQLVKAGVTDVRLALRHGSDQIIAHFAGRSELVPGGLRFLVEDEPLGTIGVLADLKPERRTVLVANGDLLCGIDLREMLAAHRARAADLTIATHEEFHRLRLGEVVTGPDDFVIDYVEKPVKRFRISSGVYLVEPEVADLIVAREWLSFPTLARRAIAAGLRVVEHFHEEPWMDVNDEADLAAATDLLVHDPVAFGLDPDLIRPARKDG
jgi:NDP-sugar pyrophosphorylase family protein